MTTTRDTDRISATGLVEQDIELAEVESEQGGRCVTASVTCARRGSVMNVEDCAQCPYFARIETHEAGYVLLCRPDTKTPPK
jgi:hypothetical protein